MSVADSVNPERGSVNTPARYECDLDHPAVGLTLRIQRCYAEGTEAKGNSNEGPKH